MSPCEPITQNQWKLHIRWLLTGLVRLQRNCTACKLIWSHVVSIIQNTQKATQPKCSRCDVSVRVVSDDPITGRLLETKWLRTSKVLNECQSHDKSHFVGKTAWWRRPHTATNISSNWIRFYVNVLVVYMSNFVFYVVKCLPLSLAELSRFPKEYGLCYSRFQNICTTFSV